MCRMHNVFLAEQAFGREHVERAIHFRQEKSKATMERPGPKPETLAQLDEKRPNDPRLQADLAEARLPRTRAECVALAEISARALSNMGFRDGEARRAIAAI